MKTPFLILSFIWVIAACTKSSIQPIEVNLPYTDAIQLAKGNYWVYESRVKNFSLPDMIDPNDSTFIKKDSLIKDSRYYRFENIFGLSQWKRDSLCYIVGIDGTIEFSAKNTTDTLYRNIDGVVGLMGGKTEKITVPAGVFSTIFFYSLEKLPVGGVPPGKNDPAYFNDRYVLLSKQWYAKSVGLVKSELYYNGSTFQRNLIRFKVNK